MRAVGMSLGAKTLLHLARLAPTCVQSMVLVSAVPRFPAATRAAFRAFAAASHSDAEWSAMRALHVHGDAQIRALYELPAMLAADETDMCFTPEELQRVAASVLLVAGDRDPLYPVELAIELYRGLPEASLWVVPHGEHNPVFGERRAEFERAALAHLARHDG